MLSQSSVSEDVLQKCINIFLRFGTEPLSEVTKIVSPLVHFPIFRIKLLSIQHKNWIPDFLPKWIFSITLQLVTGQFSTHVSSKTTVSLV